MLRITLAGQHMKLGSGLGLAFLSITNACVLGLFQAVFWRGCLVLHSQWNSAKSSACTFLLKALWILHLS